MEEAGPGRAPSAEPLASPRHSGQPLGPSELQLWFEQFRDIAVIALASAGGTITLLGTVFSGVRPRATVLVAVGWFVAAAVAALAGQTHVVDLATRPERSFRQLRAFRTGAFAMLGAGAAAFLTFALLTLIRMGR